jgi:small ligand-binding sensory domain FIST
MDTPAMAVMMGGFPEGAFRVFHATEDLALHSDWRMRQDAHFAVDHGDPTGVQTPEQIVRLATYLDGGFLVGGMTSSRQNHLQVADGLARGGVSGVMFASTVAVATGLTQGCSPIGPVHEVTKCQGNILMELDGRPALEVFYQDIGEILARDLSRVAGYIFAGLPIRGSDTGDYLVRNLVGLDSKRQWLAIGDLLEPGDPILFCRRDAQTAQHDMTRMLQQLKHRVNGRARAGLYFSCLGRGGSLFGENRELEMIREVLGDLPLVGFYANGEISHNRLYGYTGVLSLFL